jgi:hypothetical protein
LSAHQPDERKIVPGRSGGEVGEISLSKPAGICQAPENIRDFLRSAVSFHRWFRLEAVRTIYSVKAPPLPANFVTSTP